MMIIRVLRLLYLVFVRLCGLAGPARPFSALQRRRAARAAARGAVLLCGRPVRSGSILSHGIPRRGAGRLRPGRGPGPRPSGPAGSGGTSIGVPAGALVLLGIGIVPSAASRPWTTATRSRTSPRMAVTRARRTHRRALIIGGCWCSTTSQPRRLLPVRQAMAEGNAGAAASLVTQRLPKRGQPCRVAPAGRRPVPQAA